MKGKTVILSAVLLMVIASISSCSLLPSVTGPAPEPDPCCLSTPSGPLKFEPETLPSAQVGIRYEAEIHITQNSTPVSDISISNGVLPAGLEIVKVQGEDIAKISGIPEEAGAFTFTFSAWCFATMVPGQSGEKEYEIVVVK